MRWFPLSLFIYPKLCSFAPAPKNAVHFLYGAVLHRPGGTPGPLSLFCANALCKSCKKLRFLRLFAGFRLGVFSRLWNSAGCVRLGLVDFGKVWLFRCQSSPWTPYVITRKLRSFAFSPDNAVHFIYGAVLHRPALLPPLQSVFAKDTAFLSAKAQKLQKAALFAVICRFSLWNSAGCFRIWLGAFSKAGLFRCQSGIRGLWLEGFGK